MIRVDQGTESTNLFSRLLDRTSKAMNVTAGVDQFEKDIEN